MTTFVLGDVRNIQGYIFASPRLLEMRGASALLDFFNRAAVHRLAEPHGGEVIFSGGGNFLVEIAGKDSEQRAAAFGEDIRTGFFELTGAGGLTLVTLANQGPFQATLQGLQSKLRQAKRQPDAERQLASMPLLRRCDSCGKETADRPFKRPDLPAGAPRSDPRQWLGPVCSRKRSLHGEMQSAQKGGRATRHPVFIASSSSAHRCDVPHVTDYLAQAPLPADFKDLVKNDDLALIVADGNNLGSWFDDLDRGHYEALSKQVDETLRSSLDAAAHKALGDPPNLQVLLCGGDDLVVALPAKNALTFAERLLDEFEVTHPRDPDTKTGMAAGLVFCRPGFPFRQAHDLAHRLVDQAKARCRFEGLRWALGVHRVVASQVQSLDEEQAALERNDGGDLLWAYGAAGPYGPDELPSLFTLRDQLTALPQSQLGKLREILSPRDDSPATPLDCTWGFPARMVAELRTWLDRQDPKLLPPGRILDPTTGQPSPDVLRQVPPSDTNTKTQHRLILADALVLAMQGS